FPARRMLTIDRPRPILLKRWADEMDYTVGQMTQGEAPEDTLGIIVHPGAGPLLRLGVPLVIGAFERDPQATLARLADVATRGEEPFQIPMELLGAAGG